ncbi:MAG TPA: MFS transporter [Anaerolineaceae bacterium]
MSHTENQPAPRSPSIRSITAVIVGSLLLRAASGAMGINIQFYFNAIHEAALNPNHPLRSIVGAGNVYQISYALGGFIIGSFFISELLGSLVFGAWSDRFGRKKFILLGPIFGAIAVLLTSVTTAVWVLITTRLLEGLSTASSVPATLGYIAETTSQSPKLRTRISGLYEIATIGGIAIGFSLGGWLWHAFGAAAVVAGIPFTSPAFAVNALVYLLSLVVLGFGILEIKKEQKAQPLPSIHPWKLVKRYAEILRHPGVTSFALAWLSINAVLGIWINQTARILTDRRAFPDQILVGHFNSLQAGNILAGYAAFFILGILIWSQVFPQIKKTTVMLIGSGGLLVSCILIYAINHQPGFNTPLVTLFTVLLVISIMVQSGFTPAALSYLGDITELFPSDRGAIMGLYSVFLGLGQFLGASVGGLFVDWRGADGMALVAGLLGILVAFLIYRRRNMGVQ